MALDDRDRTFAKALARHLRYLPPSSETGLGTEPETGSLSSSAMPCPDPEILAAYHDGSLVPEELALWKHHVVSCEHCQLVLEHLATPLDVPVDLQSEEKVPAAYSPAPAAAKAASAAAKGASARAASITALPARRTYFRWLVPAGAVAAGLLGWVVLRESKPISSLQPAQVQTAENRQAETPQTLPPSANSSSATENKHADKDQTAGASSATGSLTRDSETKEPQDQLQLSPRALTLPKVVPAIPNLDTKQKQERSRMAFSDSFGPEQQKQLLERRAAEIAEAEKKKAAASANGRLDEEAAALDADLKRQGVAQQGTPTSLPPSQAGFVADNSINAPVVSGGAGASAPAPAPPPKPSAPAKSAPANAADSISASSETVEVAAQPLTQSNLRRLALVNPHVFGSPGGKILWRVGTAGSLEHSKNAGKDWTPQVSGVLTDLSAGSAPSTKVSWIVGSAGTILRTTDGGAHWTKLSSPATGDVVGVRATDDLHAYIWFAPDSRTGLVPSYQTNDGGATWILVPNE